MTEEEKSPQDKIKEYVLDLCDLVAGWNRPMTEEEKDTAASLLATEIFHQVKNLVEEKDAGWEEAAHRHIFKAEDFPDYQKLQAQVEPLHLALVKALNIIGHPEDDLVVQALWEIANSTDGSSPE